MKHDAVMLMGRIHEPTQKWLRGELACQKIILRDIVLPSMK